MESLLEQEVMVVKKQEELDQEDEQSIQYEITCVSHNGETKKQFMSFTITTIDRLVYERFKIGMVTDLKFLEKEKMITLPSKKTN